MSPPRLFALPPGVDFAQALVAGLERRHAADPPEAWARIRLYLATGRMARRVRAVFDAGPPRLLPRIAPVTEPVPEAGGTAGGAAGWPEIPPARPRLDLQLDLADLLDGLIARHPGLAPRSAVPGLARALGDLLDEMAGEGVPAEALARLDVADHAAHWAQGRAIVAAAAAHFGALPSAEGRRRRVVDALVARWATDPPAHPVVVAGSTGSRGATRRLMAAVALLPRGAVVLPGFDFDMPAAQWQALADEGPEGAEDHPQFRFLRLLETLGATPADVRPWSDAAAADPARNRLISLALCPAPVTDRWRAEGARLGDPRAATARLALLEATAPRQEATAIALRLRRAVADGQRAALVTPDRDLARRVAAALARWGIEPDDSGGTPLHLTPPGRLLRLAARLMAGPPALPDLLATLKHPLTATGAARGPHLRATREFELWARRRRLARPGAADLDGFAARRPAHADWAGWVRNLLAAPPDAALPDAAPLADWTARHLALTEAVAAGSGGRGSGALWDETPGREARAAMEALAAAAAGHARGFDARAYDETLTDHLSAASAQDPRRPHPDVMIWGTLEARAGGADLAILGGLNEGTWPALPPPDAWLNRRMRAEAGLLSPERRIGLAAHDFQQAIAAPEVLLTRARRDAEAETVAARWLNRLTNLLAGLGPDGAAALAEMRARGASWAARADALDRPDAPGPAAPRPSPCPPVAARPRQLSVTQVATLLRDPYAIYAREVLHLRRLNPILPLPDAALRGTALHAAMAAFLTRHGEWRGDAAAARAALAEAAARETARFAPDATAETLWRARLAAIADRLIAGEAERLHDAAPAALEGTGRLAIDAPAFTLTAKADRIDRRGDGSLAIYDYKSGPPPSRKQRALFDRQLPLEAAIAEAGGFAGLPAAPVTALGYIALGRNAADVAVHLTDEDGRPAAQAARDDLAALIAAYDDPGRGYTARRAAETTAFEGDYDHLARYGEWDLTAPATQIAVGDTPPDTPPDTPRDTP